MSQFFKKLNFKENYLIYKLKDIAYKSSEWVSKLYVCATVSYSYTILSK